ncbi:unnamed protein product [Amoebophrya sp. A25]|nr:unnamed protein product [Amoebophrya sp. A25]|eukprot:GSA25T00018335001.1
MVVTGDTFTDEAPKKEGAGEVRGEREAEQAAGSDIDKKGGSTPTTNSKPSVADEVTESNKESEARSFAWDNEELGRFWEECFPPHYDVYLFDGLHPKALCSKICNDVLRTNINVNSSSSNPNDRLLCFEVLGNLEAKFIEMGIVQKPVSKNTGNPNHVAYQRVTHQDWNRFAGFLKTRSFEAWARECVEESIRRLSQQRTKQMRA